MFFLFCFVFMTRERAQSSKEKEQNKTSNSLMVTPSQAQGAQGGQRRGKVARPCQGAQGHRGLQRPNKGKDENPKTMHV